MSSPSIPHIKTRLIGSSCVNPHRVKISSKCKPKERDIMRFYKYSLILLATLFLSACGGGSADSYDPYYTDAYIDWSGSVNGTLVIDATDDAFEFEITTGYLHFGNTTYTNAWVDLYGDFYIDGELVGAVYYVRSIDDEVITALISNDGYYIDIYGPESDLAWEVTFISPIYALKGVTTPEKLLEETIYTQTAQQTDIKTSVKGTPPEMKMNAVTEDLPTKTESTLSKH